MNNWMGRGSGDNVAYIKNNYLRLSAAIKPFNKKDSNGKYLNNGGDVWINTYLYVGCNYNWGYYDLGCWNGKTGGIQAKNNYGFFSRWDNIYWNVCPDFFDIPDFPTRVRAVTNDPSSDIHDMESYYQVQETMVMTSIFTVRSVGIYQMNYDQNSRLPLPLAVWLEAEYTDSGRGTDILRKTPGAYMYAAMAITIPEAFNTKAYPVTVGIYGLENTTDTKFFNETEEAVVVETTDSAIPPTAFPSQVSGTVTTSWTDAGDVSFTSLPDSVHTGTPSCFSAVSTSACDCGPLDGTITADGSSCVVGGATVTLQNMATVDAAGTSVGIYQSLLALEGAIVPGPTYTPPTALGAQSNPAATAGATSPPTTSAPVAPVFSAAITTTELSTSKTSAIITYCTGNDHNSYLTSSSSCAYASAPTQMLFPTGVPLWCADSWTNAIVCCTVNPGGNGPGGVEVPTCECSDGKFYSELSNGCCPYPVRSQC